MFNLIRADLFKLRKSTSIHISMAIVWLCAAAMTIISYLITQGHVGMEISGTASLFADAAMISIIGSVIAAIFICGDYENKIMNNAILGGSGRGTVVLAKSIVYFIMIALLVLPYGVVTVIAILSGYEFAAPFVPSVFLELMANEAGMALSAAVILKLITITLTMMLVYASQLSISLLLAFVLKRPVFVVGLSVILSMLLAQATQLKDTIPLLGNILALTPFALGYPDLTLNAGAGDFINAIAVSLFFMAIMLVITYFTFRRSELK